MRCAEAVGGPSTEAFIARDDRWIDAAVDSYAIFGSADAYFRVPPTEPTWVVNRKVFDFELACLAVDAGAEVMTATAATELLVQDGAVVGARVQHRGRSTAVGARLVVAADGTESQTARWAGLKTTSALDDYYTCAQYLLGGVTPVVAANVCEYHLDPEITPGGYLWVFPKGETRANVGVAIPAQRAARAGAAQALLDRFVARRYPNASILAVVAGGIPVTGAVKRMVMDGLMVVGDAAHQADPLLGGGINLAMIAADMALGVAIPALEQGDVSAAALAAYERQWQQAYGPQHRVFYRLRKLMSGLSSADVDRLVCAASELPLAQMTPVQVVARLFTQQPRLMAEFSALTAMQLIFK